MARPVSRFAKSPTAASLLPSSPWVRQMGPVTGWRARRFRPAHNTCRTSFCVDTAAGGAIRFASLQAGGDWLDNQARATPGTMGLTPDQIFAFDDSFAIPLAEVIVHD